MKKNIILISSSGGHFEQLLKLKKLENSYNLILCTERTKYKVDVDHYFSSIKLKSILFPFKFASCLIKSIKIIKKYKPVAVISTGALLAIPISLVAKIFKVKVIYIETFSRVHNPTRTGKLMYKIADLFLIQWESLKVVYPNAIYGGSLY